MIAALKTGDKLRLYYETAADFAGIEPSGIWEDFKIGMQHFTRWERVAVVINVEWIRQALRPRFGRVRGAELGGSSG